MEFGGPWPTCGTGAFSSPGLGPDPPLCELEDDDEDDEDDDGGSAGSKGASFRLFKLSPEERSVPGGNETMM